MFGDVAIWLPNPHDTRVDQRMVDVQVVQLLVWQWMNDSDCDWDEFTEYTPLNNYPVPCSKNHEEGLIFPQ